MLHYEVFNRGEDREWMVLLHGLGGNSSIWSKQIEDFAARVNVLTVDFFGHGRSRQVLPEYSFEGLGDEIFQVMDREGVHSAHLAGISLGTIVAAVMALRYPDRVRSLVLGGATPGMDARSHVLLQCGRVLKHVMPYMWLYNFFAWIMMPRRNHARSRRVFVREARKLGSREFRKWYRLIQVYSGQCREITTALQRLPLPKLYISGSEDHLFLKAVRQAVGSDPAASLQVLQGCGHVCNIERDREFNRLSLGFVHGESGVGLAAREWVEAEGRRSGRPALVTQWASR
jgi:pimeloyl-ACP methyl ester carboxylesterase